jgi:hypothetical protein
VRTGYLHFALASGIEQISGVGEYMGMTDNGPGLLRERDCYRFGSVCKRHSESRVTVCCAGPSKVRQACRPPSLQRTLNGS